MKTHMNQIMNLELINDIDIFSNPMDLQLFSLILMGMITLIIVYVILGNLLEHKHVLHSEIRYTSFTKLVSES